MVTIYSKEGCPKCRALKMKLDMKGIAYEESHDYTRMQEQGLLSLPVMEVDDRLLTFEQAVKYVNER